MNKIKIMVNWANQQIVHTEATVGSREYIALLDKGYKQVGEIKQPTEIKVFWDSRYFNPKDKYLRSLEAQTDTITT